MAYQASGKISIYQGKRVAWRGGVAMAYRQNRRNIVTIIEKLTSISISASV